MEFYFPGANKSGRRYQLHCRHPPIQLCQHNAQPCVHSLAPRTGRDVRGGRCLHICKDESNPTHCKTPLAMEKYGAVNVTLSKLEYHDGSDGLGSMQYLVEHLRPRVLCFAGCPHANQADHNCG